MTRPARPELDPVRLRQLAEQMMAASPEVQTVPPLTDSDEMKRWHELQVSQIELEMQNVALIELQAERDAAEAGRDRYATLYDRAPAGYLTLSADGRILRANRAAAEMLGCRAAALTGRQFEQFIAPQAQAALRRFLRRLFEQGARAVLEVPLFDRHADPRAGALAVGLRPIHIEANLDAEANKCRVILTDIGTIEMREAARRHALQVLDSIGEGVLVCDAEQNIVFVNPAFTTFTGYAPEEALGRNPRFLGRAGAHSADYFGEVMRCLRVDGKWRGEVCNRRPDGTPYEAQMTLTVIRDEYGEITWFVGAFSDITVRRQAEAAQLQLSRELDARVVARTAELTEANRRLVREVVERKRAEADLRESREQLSKLAEHLETVKEDERKRIARDIHDDLGQNLLALRIDISMLSTHVGVRDAKLRRHVDAALATIDTTVRNVRDIMNDLRPAVLDLGLQAALEWQAGEFRKRSGLACTLALPAEPVFAAIRPELEIVLFRALQEALSNVRRHAGASRVDIELAARDGRLRFRIADDGIGLAPQHRGKSESFGLIGMAQRVASLGGSLDLGLYVPGGGCTLTIDLDLA
jgi:PAS domain S-box-containing protein